MRCWPPSRRRRQQASRRGCSTVGSSQRGTALRALHLSSARRGERRTADRVADRPAARRRTGAGRGVARRRAGAGARRHAAVARSHRCRADAARQPRWRDVGAPCLGQRHRPEPRSLAAAHAGSACGDGADAQFQRRRRRRRARIQRHRPLARQVRRAAALRRAAAGGDDAEPAAGRGGHRRAALPPAAGRRTGARGTRAASGTTRHRPMSPTSASRWAGCGPTSAATSTH